MKIFYCLGGCIGWLAALLMSMPAVAQRVDDLYQARLPVERTDEATRRQAVREGFSEVVVRVTGRPSSLKHEPVSRLLARAEDYLLDYRYESSEALPDGFVQPGQPDHKWLVLNYDAQSLIQALKQAGLPIWGGNRPRVLMWWGMDSQGQQSLISDSEENDSVLALKNQSIKRGLPVQIPLMDYDDLRAVNVAEVFGFMDKPIRQASERYEPDAIVIGKIKAVRDDLWQGSWSLIINGRTWWYRDIKASASELLSRAVDSIADEIAALYAVETGDNAPLNLKIRIKEVEDFATWQRVNEYLEKLVAVRQARLLKVSKSVLEYALVLETDAEQFRQTLALDKKLLPVLSMELNPALETQPVLEYSWAR